MPRHDSFDGIKNTFITKIPVLSDGAVLRLGFEKVPTGIKVYMQVLENGKLLTYSTTETAHNMTLAFKTPVEMNTKNDPGYSVKNDHIVDLNALYEGLRFYFWVLKSGVKIYLIFNVMDKNGDLIYYGSTYRISSVNIPLDTPVDLNS